MRTTTRPPPPPPKRPRTSRSTPAPKPTVSPVEFELLVADSQGNKLAADDLKVRLVRERRDGGLCGSRILVRAANRPSALGSVEPSYKPGVSLGDLRVLPAAGGHCRAAQGAPAMHSLWSLRPTAMNSMHGLPNPWRSGPMRHRCMPGATLKREVPGWASVPMDGLRP